MKKIMIYCQHLAGMGHLVRCREIIQALVKDFEVCFVTGGQLVPQFQLPPEATVVYLPALRQQGAILVPLDAACSLESIKAKRQQQLLDTYDQFQPDCLITECFPFSKMSMKYELSPLLKRAKASVKPVRIVCSLRDLVMTQPLPDGPRERREAKICRLIDRFYDAVLVHGDPIFQQLEECFSLVNLLNCEIIYTGYVAQALTASSRLSENLCEPSIVASVGGGRHGYPLLNAVIAASSLIQEQLPHHFYAFAGPFMPDQEFVQLQRAAADRPNLTLRRYTSELLAYLNKADLSINLGGYNTTMNLLETGVRSLLLPSLNPSQTDEQRLRGEKLAHLGIVNLLTAQDLVPERLMAAIATSLSHLPTPHQIDLHGAENTASYLSKLLAEQPVLAAAS
ncbi:MAG: glycosyltransferase [Cyanobacteria bacterium P01_D01_bin.105]